MLNDITIKETTTAHMEVSKHRLGELVYGSKLPDDATVCVSSPTGTGTVAITITIKADRPRSADIITRTNRND